MSETVVLVHRLHPGATLPERRTDDAAGFDLAAAEPALVPARGRAAVGTGLALQLPPGIEAQVRPRSGLALHHGIGILNAPGTVDPDYRGEIKVILFNTSDEPFPIEPGQRIAQLVFARLTPVRLAPAGKLDDTGRGTGGFGHTGR